jgi:hypothetical protein
MLSPGSYDPRRLDAAKEWFYQEMLRALSERMPLEQKWLQAYKSYFARPEKEQKDFPFVKSSNLVIPIVATDVDTAVARYMSLLFEPDSLWYTKAWRPDMVEFARVVNEFLPWAQKNELRNLHENVYSGVFETVLLGTGVWKTRYRREERIVFEYREAQTDPFTFNVPTIQRQKRTLVSDSPEVRHVPLYDFFVNGNAVTLDDATWCAERVLLSSAAFASRVNSGLYMMPPNVASWNRQERGSPILQSIQQLQNLVPQRPDQLELFEAWFDWDLTGDGIMQSMVMTIHLPSRTIVRADSNPFFNQQKPYDVSRYVKPPTSFYGIGYYDMLGVFQDEITTMHNQRLDNNTISNVSMFKAIKNGNIQEGEPLFPGRILFVDDMNEMMPMAMGQPNQADLATEQAAMSYATKRTGLSELDYGVQNVSTAYGTATGLNQLSQESKKRGDLAMSNLRTALSGVGLKVLELYQQRNQRGKQTFVLGDEDGELMLQVLQFPTEIIRLGLAVEITASSTKNSKELELRANSILFSQLIGYYTQLQQFMSIAVSPQAPPQVQQSAIAAVQGMSIMMQRILDGYQIPDGKRMIPPVVAPVAPPSFGPYGNTALDPNQQGQSGGSQLALGSGSPQPGMVVR